MNIKSSLTRHQPITPMSDDELRGKAKRLYHESGTGMIRADWLTDAVERSFFNGICERLFGKRGKA